MESLDGSSHLTNILPRIQIAPLLFSSTAESRCCWYCMNTMSDMSFPPAYLDREASVTSRESRIVFTVMAIILTYLLLSFFDVLPDTFDRILWESFVRMTPSRVVYFWDKMAATYAPANIQRFTEDQLGDQQAKGEALKRLLGLDRNRFMTTFQRARSFSGIGSVFTAGKSDIPAGLGNWDNSCYQNSVIQGFASLPSVESFISDNMRLAATDKDFVTHRALKNVISDLNDNENCGRRIWTPTDLKSMSSWQQQDAQEYFSKIVDEMDKEATRVMRRSSDAGLNAAKSTHRSPRPACNPFEGLIAQRVGCMQCGYSEGLSMIPFNCLTVPLGRNWEYDIRHCLDDYTALEPIEGVECANCTLRKIKGQLERLINKIDEPRCDTENSGSEVPSGAQSFPSNGVAPPDEQVQQSTSGSVTSPSIQAAVRARLAAVDLALDQRDFSEHTLAKKCNIPGKNRTLGTKSRQAVIAKAPLSLVIHVNRSLFDEMTGAQKKNYAAVKFPKTLELSEWCLGSESTGENSSEGWVMDPSRSMLSRNGLREPADVVPRSESTSAGHLLNPRYSYRLRAVVTHYGRHENGHYIAYRKRPSFASTTPASGETSSVPKPSAEVPEHWFRFSDDDVSVVDESQVLAQGGFFMLFYELKELSGVPQTTMLLPSSLNGATPQSDGVHSVKKPEATVVPPLGQPTEAAAATEQVARPVSPSDAEHAAPVKAAAKQSPVTPVMRTSGSTKKRSNNFLTS